MTRQTTIIVIGSLRVKVGEPTYHPASLRAILTDDSNNFTLLSLKIASISVAGERITKS